MEEATSVNRTAKKKSAATRSWQDDPLIDVEAEEQLLGGILTMGVVGEGRETFLTILGRIEDNWDVFTNHPRQLIYRAMVHVADRGDPVNIASVTGELKEQDELKLVGGLEKLFNLEQRVPDYLGAGSDENLRFYCERVLECWRRRQVRATLAEAEEKVDDAKIETSDVLQNSLVTVQALLDQERYVQATSMQDALVRLDQRVVEVRDKKRSFVGLPFGFSILDQSLQGVSSEDLVILAGRPSVGKSAFAQNVAANIVLRQNLPVLFFSLEMGDLSIYTRLVAAESDVPMIRIRSGKMDEDEWKQYGATLARLESMPFYVSEAASMGAIQAEARRVKRRHSNLALIVVDYLQIMRGASRTENRTQEVTEYSSFLKRLAMDLQVPVLGLSQLSREVERRSSKNPILSDLRDSGAIEQDADIVIFLKRNDDTEGDAIQPVRWFIRKHRNGPLADGMLDFKGATLKFMEP